MTISKLSSALAIGAAALLLTVTGAFAVEANATGSVNVRSGPGTSYAVLGQLQRGDNVNISRQSNGWCRVSMSGPDGWVSCRYLTASNDDFYDDDDYGRGDRYSRPGVTVQFGFGNNSRGWYNNDRRGSRNWNNGPRWNWMN